jgi:hypothetical protein
MGSDMANIEPARRALISRILDGDGQTTPGERHAAFDGASPALPLRAFLEKVATHARGLTDEDVAAVVASGFGEDQVFELTVCAAVAQSTRQYEAALAALEAATKEHQHASSNSR